MNENFPSPGKPRLRRLSAEEIELWLNVTRGVARRPGSRLPQPLEARNGAEVLSPSVAGNKPPKAASAETPRLPAERKAPPPLAPLERRLRQKLARGRTAPDAVIDLHGLRRHEAFAALREFLARVQSEGARLVLVVTGKGERASSGEATPGILRKSVPDWLRGADFHAIVAGFEEAARPHGGTGALYVRLRRRDRAGRGKPSP